MSKHHINIFPVIHFLNSATTLEQAELAFDAGADGLFLINHHGDDGVLAPLGAVIKEKYPDKKIGLNFLANGPYEALRAAIGFKLDMAWGDNCGISSRGPTAYAQKLRHAIEYARKIGTLGSEQDFRLFASVAFKYQPIEPFPAEAAIEALKMGYLPTTSGEATGAAPTLEKIQLMSKAVDGNLAIASGMTAENIQRFAPLLSDVLVATGVSRDDHHFDYELLYQFIVLARQAKSSV